MTSSNPTPASSPKKKIDMASAATALAQLVPDKPTATSSGKAEAADLAIANKAAKDPSAKPEATVRVKDYSSDKPNRPVEEYRSPRDGKFWVGSGAKQVSARDSGINRFAILIARPGGCTEIEGRHVNPRGFEYSGSFAGYVADNTGMTVVVADGRYQVGEKDPSGVIRPNENARKGFFDALGGQAYLDRVVDFIRSNAKYDYSGFTLSGPAPAPTPAPTEPVKALAEAA
jgi:hypothetical protein